MLDYMNKADVALRIQYALQAMTEEDGRGCDAMKKTMLLSGMLVETAFLFDNCEESLQATFIKLRDLLNCEPLAGDLAYDAMPPPSIIEFDAEMGRSMAREFFEEWLD